MSAFEIKTQWVRTNSTQLVDSTLCKLQLLVAGKNVTAYSEGRGHEEDHLQLPSYYLAEWIAENWWPLLWEPRKSEEDADESGFRSRHNFTSAQRGFTLPSVTFTSTGKNVEVFANVRKSEINNARFLHSATGIAQRADLEGVFRKFIEQTISRLPEGSENFLQQHWQEIAETDAEAVAFCKCFGALGLSPYDERPEIEATLDDLSGHLNIDQMLRLCQAVSPINLAISAKTALAVQSALSSASEIDLSQLADITAPSENLSAPAWRYGYQAAEKLRTQFGLKENDIDSGRAVLAKLNIDPKSGLEIKLNDDTPINGATTRHGDAGRMVLTAGIHAQRRFAAARAAYFFWTAHDEEEVLITTAVTREQQASRAFAAEMLFPQAYVRSQASGGKLKAAKLFELAEREQVSPKVIRWQAQNSGIQVS